MQPFPFFLLRNRTSAYKLEDDIDCSRDKVVIIMYMCTLLRFLDSDYTAMKWGRGMLE